MKQAERRRAVELRKEGLTYGEIRKEIPVSKSSLSVWLKDIKISDANLARINFKNHKIKEKFASFNAVKHRESLINKEITMLRAKSEIDILTADELKLFGIALYWAEGYKGLRWGTVSFTNSDPAMIKIIMRWFREICCIPQKKFRVRIQCHGPGNVEKSQKYWSEISDIPISQFTKPYVRTSPSSKNKAGNSCPYGVCHIRISDVFLLTKIKGWIAGISGLSSSPV